jgi:peptidoglycan/xylan/chitin deacetylase (PgdA/CDA1 family)
MQVPAALSVDLEFFQHAPAYRTAAGTAEEPAIGREGAEFLLEAFERAGATGTFFTVSDIAADHADLLDRVASSHELGSHTHSHRHLSELRTDERREELAGSRERLEAATGADVAGFRAPSFDLAADHFPTLAATGYEYDSSVVPARSIPGWYGGEHRLQRPAPATAVDPDAPAGLAEVPVAVMPGLGLPLTGTWIRFFGVRYTLLGMRWLARRGVAPVLYVHPWELVDIPRIEGVPRRIYVRSGAYMRRAVERILASPFDFIPVRTLADGVERGAPEGGAPGGDTAAVSRAEGDP